MGYDGDGSVSTRASAFRSGGASVISFGTAKSAMSKMSRKTDCTIDAVVVSQATAQAVQAAKAILNAGGSELTALKTAKAAALSALIMPESAEHDIHISGLGSSFLRRRKMKRQAEVVASMALASAMASCQAGVTAININISTVKEWDHCSGSGSGGSGSLSLDELHLLSGGTNSLTLSSRGSGSASEGRGAPYHKSSKKSQTAAEMISSQLRMLPSLASTFSGGDGGITRQTSSLSYDTQYAGSAQSSLPTPRNMGPRSKYRHQRQENCSGNLLFSNHPGCGIDHGYSDDASTGSDLFSTTNPMDSMLMSIAGAFNCGPQTMSATTRPTREVRVPIIDVAGTGTDGDDEYNEDEDEDEETITFTSESREEKEDTKSLAPEALSQEATEATAEAEEESIETAVPMEIPSLTVSISKYSIGDTSVGANSDQILEDLLASTSAASPSSQASGTFTAVISPEKNIIETEVLRRVASVDDLKVNGTITGVGVEEELDGESANYVQIVNPQKRSRRLTRSAKKLGSMTPANATGTLNPKLCPQQADAPKGKPSIFRKKWRK